MSAIETLKTAATLEDLAGILGYRPSSLAFILYRMADESKYRKFTIPKSGGGKRQISAPNSRLKLLQRHLANTLSACRDHIDATHNRRSLSHGFRRRHSILSNANNHKRQRYVLNLDLQDFFPTFNFGRVRGFFIRNNDFKLHPVVATIIAQIACFENSLPQGSPCSPIIADLIAHVLDVRLVQLARAYLLTYSRYADDLTFSTSQRTFPAQIARPAIDNDGEWELGDELIRAIMRSGFSVNPAKTRMQFRMSRQLVTGLTVNAKVNIRPEYYSFARAMCNSLFYNGFYHRPDEPDVPITTLGPLEGTLSHIHHIKDNVDRRKKRDKKEQQTASRKLYARFLAYRYFVCLERPLIICEGKTDNIYIKHAIANLSKFQPRLGSWEGESFKCSVSFFNYRNQASDILDIGGGISDLKFFFIPNRFKRVMDGFKYTTLKFPIIVLIDNDKGGREIFATIRKN